AVAYHTYPHVDQRTCGRQAATLLVRMLRGEIRPCQALAKPSVVVNILTQETSREPMKTLLDEAASLVQRPGILAVNLLPGFAYADVPQMGPSVVVVADGDAGLARREADRLADRLWQVRGQLTAVPPDTSTAVVHALEADRLPVVLVDCGDNVGG